MAKMAFMRKIEYLVVHHSASPRAVTLETIRRWHVEERGWADIGYHWVIEGDGKIRRGRSVYLMGAHARPHNRDSLGVCLPGDNTKVGVPQYPWNDKQIRSLRELVAACRLVFPDLQVVGHRDLSNTNTVCPGLDVKEIL